MLLRTGVNVVAALAFLGLVPDAAGQAAPVPLAERARGADRVVVGRVASVAPRWQVNEFGDQLIVSVVRVTVSETLKGEAAPTLDVEVEGGRSATSRSVFPIRCRSREASALCSICDATLAAPSCLTCAGRACSSSTPRIEFLAAA